MTVIFIHGVISSEKAWQHPDGTFWPYLVQEEDDLREYGLYLFNYRTDVFSGSHSLDDVTAKLQHQIEQDLPDERGLVFVGHSMGGIVARNYIVRQNLELYKRKIKIGVVLIASPSAGSSYANLVARLSPLYHSQLYALRSGQRNDWLSALDRHFMKVKESGHVDISGKEMIEDNALGALRFFLQRAQIVPPASAAKYFADYVRIEYSDHISISKPRERDAQQHRVLCQWLRSFAGGRPRGAALPERTIADHENIAVTPVDPAPPEPARKPASEQISILAAEQRSLRERCGHKWPQIAFVTGVIAILLISGAGVYVLLLAEKMAPRSGMSCDCENNGNDKDRILCRLKVKPPTCLEPIALPKLE